MFLCLFVVVLYFCFELNQLVLVLCLLQVKSLLKKLLLLQKCIDLVLKVFMRNLVAALVHRRFGFYAGPGDDCRKVCMQHLLQSWHWPVWARSVQNWLLRSHVLLFIVLLLSLVWRSMASWHAVMVNRTIKLVVFKRWYRWLLLMQNEVVYFFIYCFDGIRELFFVSNVNAFVIHFGSWTVQN